MAEFPSHKKESGINRVVGFEPETEKGLLEFFKKRFENNEQDSDLEKEKTAEQIEIIARINNEMREFLASYGIEAIEISPQNIHIIDKSKFTEEQLRKIEERFGTDNGFFSADKQGIAIMKDYEASKLLFLHTLVHETLHLQGFFSYQKTDPETADFTLKNEDEAASMNPRRSGFSIGTTDGEKLLFNDLNESIITELEIRFEKKYMVHYPELETELKAREEYTQQIAERRGVPVEKMREGVAGMKGDTWVTYAYHDERQQFNELIDELYKRNKADFESREQVFDLFAKATMTGRLLPIARLIEHTFGKGSFRMIGERTAK
jgi:hypothetical protein